MIVFTDTLDLVLALLPNRMEAPTYLRVQMMPTDLFKAFMIPPKNESVGRFWVLKEHDDLLRYLFFDESPFMPEPEESISESSHPMLSSVVKDLSSELILRSSGVEGSIHALSPQDTLVVVGNYSYPRYDSRTPLVLIVNVEDSPNNNDENAQDMFSV